MSLSVSAGSNARFIGVHGSQMKHSRHMKTPLKVTSPVDVLFYTIIRYVILNSNEHANVRIYANTLCLRDLLRQEQVGRREMEQEILSELAKPPIRIVVTSYKNRRTQHFVKYGIVCHSGKATVTQRFA